MTVKQKLLNALNAALADRPAVRKTKKKRCSVRPATQEEIERFKALMAKHKAERASRGT